VYSWYLNFPEFRARLRSREVGASADIESSVRTILEAVRVGGDEALGTLTARFDAYQLTPTVMPIAPEAIKAAYQEVSPSEIEVLQAAAANIRTFHQRQVRHSWSYEEGGVRLGVRFTPLQRVGLYVPGGQALYPSTVLMTAMPAQVAGVQELLLCTPAREGRIHPLLLVAADIAGVEKIFPIGGAQAIAAMAYGTERVPAVDKVVGPGNIYVATAKRLLFGQVGIDLIAGPSEILIIADDSADPAFVAADLLSQAEHTGNEFVALLTPSEKLGQAVQTALTSQLTTLQRQEMARRSLTQYGAIIITRSLEEAVQLANEIAPEHLELAVADPARLLELVHHAGAVFLGHHSPETIGDYFAGPSHVLPTNGTARFASPLGVDDFVKKTSVIEYTPEQLARVGETVCRFAQMEGYDAHAKAVQIRLDTMKRKG
jgi:histidinol dehydrogenase